MVSAVDALLRRLALTASTSLMWRVPWLGVRSSDPSVRQLQEAFCDAPPSRQVKVGVGTGCGNRFSRITNAHDIGGESEMSRETMSRDWCSGLYILTYKHL